MSESIMRMVDNELVEVSSNEFTLSASDDPLDDLDTTTMGEFLVIDCYPTHGWPAEGWKSLTGTSRLYELEVAYPVLGRAAVDAEIAMIANEAFEDERASLERYHEDGFDYGAAVDWWVEPTFVSDDIVTVVLTGHTTYGGVGWDPNVAYNITGDGERVELTALMIDGGASALYAAAESGVQTIFASAIEESEGGFELVLGNGDYTYGLIAGHGLAAFAEPESLGCGSWCGSPVIGLDWETVDRWIDDRSVLGQIARRVVTSESLPVPPCSSCEAKAPWLPLD
jgi:hypothetical protein